MRTLLAFVLALLAVYFGFQNQGAIDIKLGPYLVNANVATALLSTFILGVFTGLMVALPRSWRKGD